jgi:threonine dehydratase
MQSLGAIDVAFAAERASVSFFLVPMKPSFVPGPAEVRDAARRIAGTVTRTPLRPSTLLSQIAGGDVHLKLETGQITGSFKLRGAFNSLSLLDEHARRRGVVASSAGNHGLGVAHAAKALGIRATLFVPATAPRIKRDGIAALGADVNADEPDYDAAMVRARKFARDTGATFVHPCLGLELLAGQGTVALEIVEQLPGVATVLTCVGGAGLLGGMSGFLRGERPDVHLIGAQTERTNAMAVALEAGHLVDIPSLPTLADGLAGQIDNDALEIGRYGLDALAVLTEDETAKAIAWLWRHEGVRAEGSGAVTVGAILARKAVIPKFPAVCVVSGRNIDDSVFEKIIAAAPAS